jgi:hydrogenase-1 operon protein HyaF
MTAHSRIIALHPLPMSPLAAAFADETALVEALLTEVQRQLEQLAAHPSHEATIALNALADDGVRATLRQRLGDGEVQARVLSACLTELSETAYPGCWWQRQGEPDALGALDPATATESILITRCPALLAAHPDDVSAAAARLRDVLTSSNPTEGPVHG